MGREAYERMTTLPPMSSFHQDTIQGQRYHHASPVASPLTSNDPSVLGKTLNVARPDISKYRSHILVIHQVYRYLRFFASWLYYVL